MENIFWTFLTQCQTCADFMELDPLSVNQRSPKTKEKFNRLNCENSRQWQDTVYANENLW